jgi:NAD(P)-dependent dehydrogenase (short-subunit alcohol dehydrogenase family)
MNSIRTYDGAVAVVTGGASGIGAALSRQLAARGATVVVADRQAELARRTAAALARPGEAHELDVRDAAAFVRLLEDVWARQGRLDYLFNNAGTGVGGEAKDFTLDDWRYLVEVNLMGVIHGIHAAYARMIRQGFGHIVNTASVAGLMPSPGGTLYAATKHAVVGLSRSLRCEARPYGVRVGCLCPGVIRTAILVGGGVYGGMKIAAPASAQLAMWERLRPMDPDRFAAAVLRDVARDVPLIIHPRWWRALRWLDRLAPVLTDALMTRGWARTKAELEAAARTAPATPTT